MVNGATTACPAAMGSDRGGERAAAMYSLIVTAKLNDTGPRAWLADVLRRIGDHPASRLHVWTAPWVQGVCCMI
jgi:transposase